MKSDEILLLLLLKSEKQHNHFLSKCTPGKRNQVFTVIISLLEGFQTCRFLIKNLDHYIHLVAVTWTICYNSTGEFNWCVYDCHLFCILAMTYLIILLHVSFRKHSKCNFQTNQIMRLQLLTYSSGGFIHFIKKKNSLRKFNIYFITFRFFLFLFCNIIQVLVCFQILLFAIYFLWDHCTWAH